MANENKRYYWLKFQEDFFSSLRVKKLRKLGADYLIIYLKMQLFSLKTNGYLKYKGLEDTFAQELALELDEDTDKVQLTLSFLQSCGLLECSEDNEFFLPYVKANTGSETASTQRSRACRDKKKNQKLLQCNSDAADEQQKLLQCNTSATNIQQDSNTDCCNATQVQQQCSTEIRDKSIDKKKTLSKERVKEKVAAQHFSAPTLEEVKQYSESRETISDVELFYNYYEARGWDGIKDWKAALRAWEKREKPKQEHPPEGVIKKSMFKDFAQRDYDFKELEAKMINQTG